MSGTQTFLLVALVVSLLCNWGADLLRDAGQQAVNDSVAYDLRLHSDALLLLLPTEAPPPQPSPDGDD